MSDATDRASQAEAGLRVTLVPAPLTLNRYAAGVPAVPPIGLASVAASLRQDGHHVRVVDGLGEAVDQYVELSPLLLQRGLSCEETVERIAPSDVIGVGVLFSQDWPRARRLLEAIRERFPDATLLAGGEHPSADPHGVLRDTPAVDYVVCGEGELVAGELLEHLAGRAPLAGIPNLVHRGMPDDASGEALGPYGERRVRSIEDIPWPAWDLLPIRNYLDGGHGWGVHRGRSMPMIASRGCPYRCTFCSSPTMWTTRWVVRDVNDVLAEIRHYVQHYDATNFDFHDLTMIVKRRWIVEFCERILDEKLGITWQLPTGTRSEVIDDEVARLLHASGCRNVALAPESGDAELLERVQKRVDLDRVTDAVRACTRADISVKGNFMVGFPGDTYRSQWPTLRYLWKLAWLGVDDVSLTSFAPYPGSQLFREFQERGRIPTVLDDAYFDRLTSFDNLTSTESWTEHISSKGLARVRLFGLASFYAVSWTRHPSRAWARLRNFLAGREQTRLDKSLGELRRRLLTLRSSPAAGGAV